MPALADLCHTLVQYYIQVKPLFMKTGDNELILHFWRKFLHPSLPLNKETASKRNIWGPFYISKSEGLGGDQRK